MKFTLLATLAAMALPQIAAIVPPGADTPAFYLVSSSNSASSNLLPLRTIGGAGGYSTLTGTGPIGQFYFFQGKLVAAPAAGSSTTQKPVIGSIPLSDCTTYGPLGFTGGSSSDKCAMYNSFYIQSDTENSQLGAKLTFNFVGGFYACGSNQDVWYLASPSDGPPNLTCNPIGLWTVPV